MKLKVIMFNLDEWLRTEELNPYTCLFRDICYSYIYLSMADFVY